MSATVAGLTRAAVDRKRVALLSSGAIAFGVFLSGFVIDEPAPYELYMAGLIGIWALFGLSISRAVAPLLVLLVIFNIGGMIAMTQMAELYNTPLYLCVSLFLALTAVFFAATLEADPNRYRLIARAWIAAALITAVLGIVGYFGLVPGAEMFTKYGRAAGTFQDPNVFGPFLAFPGIWLLYRLVTGSPRAMPLTAAALLIVCAGIFFSFSRGAWGLFAISALMLLSVLFMRSRSGAFRLRIVVMSLCALALLVLGLLVMLQIPSVAELFSSRAHLAQDYDTERLGRFARYTIGFRMAMDKPLGIGALNFGRIYGEDTHDIWLKALMDYGWLGFAAWLTMILWTVIGGFRILFRERPWQPYLLCAYVVLLGHIGLGTVIDTDHWRHFYLLLGLIWGAIALEESWGRSKRAAAAPAAASPGRA